MKNYLYIISLIAFAACTSSIELEIELDKHESKQVVNSFFSPSDSITIHLSKSVPVFDQESNKNIENAEVELYCQEELQGTMNSIGNGYYSLSTPIVANKEYSIVVNTLGFSSVSAKNIIPGQVHILSFDTISINKELLYCEIDFNNDLEKLDHYLLEVTSKYPVLDADSISSNQVDMFKSDLIIENGDLGSVDKRSVFSNAYINDSIASVGFVLDKQALINSCMEGSNTVYIHFKKISEAYYKYIHFYYRSQSNQNEPSYTNTKNGYGIFAGFTVSVDSFEIRE